jgi:uncharacterized protein
MTKIENAGQEDKASVPKNFITVLAEPTSYCNMDCVYCYKGHNKKKFHMSQATTEKMLSEIIRYNEERGLPSAFVWHGGEPTLRGVEFYQHVYSFIASLGCRYPVSHTVQTNGTLLTTELIDLFMKNETSISVSLDGPEAYHDNMRPFIGGKPTHAIILNNIEKAKKAGLEIGVLMSVSNENMGSIRGMFDYCRENRFTFGLNPLTDDLHSTHASMVTPENYLTACIEVFDLWFFQKDYAVQVNPGWGVTSMLLSKGYLSDCNMSENCQMHFISIGPEGDVYPCNRFYGFDEYKYGNINESSVEEIMNCDRRKELQSRCSSRIEKCMDCSIANYCNGGCVHHAIVHNKSTFSNDHLCTVYRGLISHAIRRLNQNL